MPARFSKVDDNVLRGGAPSEKDLGALKHIWKVNKIVSLDGEVGDKIAPICESLGLEHVIIPLGSGNDPGVDKLPGEIATWPSSGPVYVHCLHGKDRTSMACALYRMFRHGWDINLALAEARNFGMGKGLDPATHDSYYEAVKRLSVDRTACEDIASMQRDSLESYGPSSYSNDSEPYQMSWAPFLDGESNHLNMSAFERYNELLKLANKEEELLDKKDEDEEDDTNNALDVGLHDNYTGMAPYSVPGTGGSLGTSFVEIPYSEGNNKIYIKMIKRAYAIQMSFDVPDAEKRVAEKAYESFEDLLSLLRLASTHLDIIYEPFKKLQSPVDAETIMEYRVTFRDYRDKIKENYDEIIKKAYNCALLMGEFSSDNRIVDMMNAFVSAKDDLEKQVNRLLSIFSNLNSSEFAIYLTKAIELVKKENSQLKDLINDRVLEHISTNILAKNWVNNVTDENQRKVYERLPLIVELFRERQKAMNNAN